VAGLDHGENIDAVAGAAALHQQYTPRAAELRAREHGDAFLLGRQRNRLYIGVGEGAVD
jgi:hypothetical protein